jgi:hypothetical protein
LKIDAIKDKQYAGMFYLTVNSLIGGIPVWKVIGFGKIKFIGFLFVLMALSMICFSQGTNDFFLPDSKRFMLEVKQLDQFINRFNNAENLIDGKKKADSLLLEEKKHTIKFRDERTRLVRSLFNYDDSILCNDHQTINFIYYIINSSNDIQLSYFDRDWYAVVDCKIKYQGKIMPIYLTLEVEGNADDGYKWIIAGVSASFINLPQLFQDDSLRFISPKNNELNFMDLMKAFDDSENIEKYATTTFVHDDLNIFFYMVRKKEIQFIQVNHIQYHFLQIPNWAFTVDFYNRANYNSGWLISSLSCIPDSIKVDYKRNNLHLLQ